MHGACVAARYCGGNGVAENGKAAAVVHTTSASLLSLLTVVALRLPLGMRGNATVACVKSYRASVLLLYAVKQYKLRWKFVVSFESGILVVNIQFF